VFDRSVYSTSRTIFTNTFEILQELMDLRRYLWRFTQPVIK
jgi:hypothetical protein